MASSTRRMSGMVASAGPGGQALLDTLEQFRRKHVNQNKEIIHRNSDLMRNNADLTRQLRDVQNDLITLRAENMQLKAANLQLQVSVAGLTDKLGARSREDERTGQSVQEEQRLRLLVGQLDQVVEQIQGIRSACLEGAIGDAYAQTQRPSRLTPADYATQLASPPESPPFSHPQFDILNTVLSHYKAPAAPVGLSSSSAQGQAPSSSLTKRDRFDASNPPPPPIVSAEPDLSFISEASQEPSLTASQRLGGMCFEEEDDDEYLAALQAGGPAGCEIAEADVALVEAFVAAYSPVTAADQQVHTRRYRAAHEEEEDDLEVARQIEISLVAPSPERRRRKSISMSPSPTPSPPAQAPNLDSVLQSAQDTLRYNRRRNSAVLPAPPKDLTAPPASTSSSIDESRRHPGTKAEGTGVAASAEVSQAAELRKKRSRSALLESESSEADKSVGGRRTSRERSTSVSSAARPPDNPAVGLARTIRPSSSTSSLSELARSPTSSLALLAASSSSVAGEASRQKPEAGPVQSTTRPVTRRKSVPALLSPAPPEQDTTPIPAVPALPDTLDRQPREKEKKRALVGSMQPRPSGGPVSLVVRDTAVSGASSTAPASGSSRPRAFSASSIKTATVPATQRRLSSAGGASASTKSLGSSAAPAVSRRRSTTPDVEPPPVVELDASISVRTNIVEKGKARPASVETCEKEKTVSSRRVSKSLSTNAGKHEHALPALETAEGAVLITRAPKTSPASSTLSAALQPLSRHSSTSSTLTLLSPKSLASSGNTTVSSLSESTQESQSQSQKGSSKPAAVEAPSGESQNSGREARRARSTVNYQEPSLTKKMRQPAGYVPSIKTVSSMRGVSGHHSSGNLGPRRKSSLEVGSARQRAGSEGPEANMQGSDEEEEEDDD